VATALEEEDCASSLLGRDEGLEEEEDDDDVLFLMPSHVPSALERATRVIYALRVSIRLI